MPKSIYYSQFDEKKKSPSLVKQFPNLQNASSWKKTKQKKTTTNSISLILSALTASGLYDRYYI